MNSKQEQFVSEYLQDHNATMAAQRCGYSKRTAYSQGQRLLKHVEVKAALASALKRVGEKAELSATRVLEELRRLAFGDRTELLQCQTVADLRKLPAELRALVVDFEVYQANLKGVRDGLTERVRRVKTVSKVQALEMLAKHFKLLTEVSEVQASEELLARLDRGRERNAARGRESRKR